MEFYRLTSLTNLKRENFPKTSTQLIRNMQNSLDLEVSPILSVQFVNKVVCGNINSCEKMSQQNLKFIWVFLAFFLKRVELLNLNSLIQKANIYYQQP